MVSKRLNTLKTFIRKSIPHAEEASSLIRFKFIDEYLTVSYVQQETFLEEWKVTPCVKSPYHIYKEDVDMFGRKKHLSPPYCWFIVEALKDSSKSLAYPIDIEEIESPQTILIVVHNMEESSKVQASPLIEQQQLQIGGKCTQQFDIDQLKKLIVEVVDQHYADLCELLNISIKSSSIIANKMFQEHLINNEVKDNPTGNGIIDEFKASFVWISKKSQAESHCKSFLKVFCDHGGSFQHASEVLKCEWLEKAQIGMGVDLNLN